MPALIPGSLLASLVEADRKKTAANKKSVSKTGRNADGSYPKGYFMPGGAGYKGTIDNPFYGTRDTTKNVRYDENAGRGSNIPNIASFKQARDVYATYQALKPGQKGYENARNFNNVLKKVYGISDWNKASDEVLFSVLDDVFQGYQEDNKKENFGFDDIAGSLINIAAPIAGGLLGGPIGASIAGGLSSGIQSGSVTSGLLGAAGGFFGGSSLNNAFGVGKGGLLNLPGGSIPGNLINSAKNFVGLGKPAAPFHSGALGIGPENLFETGNFAGLGGAGTSAGFTPSIAASSGLGLSVDDLFSPFFGGRQFGNTINFDGGGFINPDVIKPDQFFNPETSFASLGGTPTSNVSDIIKEIAKQVGELTTLGVGSPPTPRFSGGRGSTTQSRVPQIDFTLPNLFGPTGGNTTSGLGGNYGRPIEQPGALSSKLLADKFGSPDPYAGSPFNLQARGQGLGGPTQRGQQRKQALAALV